MKVFDAAPSLYLVVLSECQKSSPAAECSLFGVCVTLYGFTTSWGVVGNYLQTGQCVPCKVWTITATDQRNHKKSVSEAPLHLSDFIKQPQVSSSIQLFVEYIFFPS